MARTIDRAFEAIGALLGQRIQAPPPSRMKPEPRGFFGTKYPIPGKPWTREFIASKEFLDTDVWRRLRYDALEASDGRCQLCGRNKHQLPRGEYLNVDHVKNRRDFPHLALTFDNLEILCGPCNAGRGNRSQRDWRKR